MSVHCTVQMVLTLREVLRRKKPEPDTLGLQASRRFRLCLELLDDSIPSWKNLADHIGNYTQRCIAGFAPGTRSTIDSPSLGARRRPRHDATTERSRGINRVIVRTTT